MESFTKNRQSRETMESMVKYAFGDTKMAAAEELTEGFFNVAYLVTLSDGRETVLKIAPSQSTRVMTCEKGIMRTEAESMRLVGEKTDVPVPDVLFYDGTHSVCESDYFFMSELEGKSLNLVSNELSETEQAAINHTLGHYNAEINAIAGPKFGYYGQPEKQGNDWFTVFSSIVHDVLNDAAALKIDVGVPYETVVSLLASSRDCFEENLVPHLVHWDLWAGNVFIQDKKISGLIDFERCLWADPLMEVGFRSLAQNKDFLEGYGAVEFTAKQKKRIIWYDLYLFLLNSLETDYRKYPNDDMLVWARKQIVDTVGKLKAETP